MINSNYNVGNAPSYVTAKSPETVAPKTPKKVAGSKIAQQVMGDISDSQLDTNTQADVDQIFNILNDGGMQVDDVTNNYVKPVSMREAHIPWR